MPVIFMLGAFWDGDGVLMSIWDFGGWGVSVGFCFGNKGMTGIMNWEL
jgi:hypothetical protein